MHLAAVLQRVRQLVGVLAQALRLRHHGFECTLEGRHALVAALLGLGDEVGHALQLLFERSDQLPDLVLIDFLQLALALFEQTLRGGLELLTHECQLLLAIGFAFPFRLRLALHACGILLFGMLLTQQIGLLRHLQGGVHGLQLLLQLLFLLRKALVGKAQLLLPLQRILQIRLRHRLLGTCHRGVEGLLPAHEQPTNHTHEDDSDRQTYQYLHTFSIFCTKVQLFSELCKYL